MKVPNQSRSSVIFSMHIWLCRMMLMYFLLNRKVLYVSLYRLIVEQLQFNFGEFGPALDL